MNNEPSPMKYVLIGGIILIFVYYVIPWCFSLMYAKDSGTFKSAFPAAQLQKQQEAKVKRH